MKVFTFGIGMFGFPILNHISDNKEFDFFAYEKNQEVVDSLIKERKHPNFFTEKSLSLRVTVVRDYHEILPDMDVVILIIPYQALRTFLGQIRPYLKPGVLLLNLSKGINNETFTTAGEDIAQILAGINYRYAVLSGGMIATELSDGALLGADIAVTHKEDEKILKNLFHRKNLEIHTTQGNTKQIELAGALKNILALAVGYYENKGYGASSIGWMLVSLYRELEMLLPEFGWDGDFPFSYYAIGGDIIATCFGSSRNRYLGKLVGCGLSVPDALEKLKKEKKIAEGYFTLLGISKRNFDRQKYPHLQSLVKIFFGE